MLQLNILYVQENVHLQDSCKFSETYNLTRNNARILQGNCARFLHIVQGIWITARKQSYPLHMQVSCKKLARKGCKTVQGLCKYLARNLQEKVARPSKACARNLQILALIFQLGSTGPPQPHPGQCICNSYRVKRIHYFQIHSSIRSQWCWSRAPLKWCSDLQHINKIKSMERACI